MKTNNNLKTFQDYTTNLVQGYQIKTNHGYQPLVITNMGNSTNAEALKLALEAILPPAENLGSNTKLTHVSILQSDDNLIYHFTFYSRYDAEDPDYQGDVQLMLRRNIQQEAEDPNPQFYTHWDPNTNIFIFTYICTL